MDFNRHSLTMKYNDQKNFLNPLHKYLFVFAAVVMASVALSSCSRSDDESNELPIKQNTIIIDNEESPIRYAMYTVSSVNNDYGLTLSLSEDKNEEVVFMYNYDQHCNKDLDLTKRDEQFAVRWNWSIAYYNQKHKQIINTNGKPQGFFPPNEPITPVFDKGTLHISVDVNGNIKVLLKNGKVVGTDKRPHILTINYEGSLKKIGELED